MRTILPSLALGLLAVACSTGQPMESNPTSSKPSPAIQEATFASGWFWGAEAVYRAVDGVIETEVGFIGGHVVGASYQQVCSGETGHAEAVHMKFDPSKVDYEQLLAIFWDNHDPTQTDGQGVNLGEQYRSAIFFHSQEQQKVAEKSRASLVVSGRYSRPITTSILEATDFVRAEDYHQQYYEKQGLIRGR